MGRILVIEDDAPVRGILREVLEMKGYRVAEAENGKVGMKHHKKNPFDLVITDIFMPVKDGLETIAELREDYPGVKIIAISGVGIVKADCFLEVACELGADSTFQKPFKMEEMFFAIEGLLGKGKRKCERAS